MRSPSWIVAVGAGAAVGTLACYAPSPPTGAPCGTGGCPTPLVCSPATLTCEREPVAIDAPSAVDGARPADARADGPPAGDASVPFATLTGLQWLLPCTAAIGSNSCACDATMRVVHLADPDPRLYDVTVRIRGVMEGGSYQGGTAMGNWYVGGASTNPLLNIYELDVTSPSAHYFLNAVPGAIAELDYTVTLPITSDATLTLTSDGQDGRQLKNLGSGGAPLVIPGVATTPSPYDGQFAQLDVVSVVLAPLP